MSVHLLLPVRPPEEGKSRLATAISREERLSLNNNLFDRVLSIVTEVFPVARITVISRSATLLGRARTAGTEVEVELGEGLNPALTQAGQAVARRGATGLLAVSSDLPWLTADDLRAMLAADTPVAIATDRDGTGTNALLMRPPLAIPFRYGPASLAAHLGAARAAGLAATVIRRPGLAGDLDTPADLAEYRRAPGPKAPPGQAERFST